MSRLISASDYQREVAELRALIASEERTAEQLGWDFSSELTVSSLRSRLEELEAELGAIGDADLPGHELEVVFAGVPVRGHKVRADFLAGVLDELQKLVHALVNTQFGREAHRGSWPEDVIRRSTLEVSETFAGSFGVKLEAIDEQLELEGHLVIQPAFEDLFNVLSSEKSGGDFLEELAPIGSRARMHLRTLMNQVTKAEASLDMRWPLVDGEKRARIGYQRAGELAELLGRIEEQERLESKEGLLGGANIRTGYFELQLDDDSPLAGRVSKDMGQAIADFFGRRVVAELLVTRVTDRGTGVERETYRLMSLKLAEETDGV